MQSQLQRSQNLKRPTFFSTSRCGFDVKKNGGFVWLHRKKAQSLDIAHELLVFSGVNDARVSQKAKQTAIINPLLLCF